MDRSSQLDGRERRRLLLTRVWFVVIVALLVLSILVIWSLTEGILDQAGLLLASLLAMGPTLLYVFGVHTVLGTWIVGAILCVGGTLTTLLAVSIRDGGEQFLSIPLVLALISCLGVLGDAAIRAIERRSGPR